jgi:galactose oxidase-like protein
MSQILWTQKQDIGPSPRSNVVMVFDSVHARVVLFGGLAADNSTVLNDTWQWDGENWTQVADIGPPARSQHAMAFDSVRGRAVLFGGAAAIGVSPVLLPAPRNDTWEWDGEDWTQIADTGPAPRVGAAMTYDGKRGRVLLFGGSDAAQSFGDTWAWNGIEWTQEQDSGPPARAKHGLAYDAARDRVVLFGGVVLTQQSVTVTVNNSSGMFGFLSGTHTETQLQTMTQFFNDTWEYDGALWTRAADTGPDPRAGSGLVYSGTACLLFGGKNNSTPFKDTWQWDGKHWTERQDIGPAARALLGSAYDGARQRMVMFGGVGALVLGDTWEASERNSQVVGPR